MPASHISDQHGAIAGYMPLMVALLVTPRGCGAQQTPPQPAPQSVYENLVYRASADNQETQEVRPLRVQTAVLLADCLTHGVVGWALPKSDSFTVFPGFRSAKCS